MPTPPNSRKSNLLSNGAVESFWDALWLELWPLLWSYHLRLQRDSLPYFSSSASHVSTHAKPRQWHTSISFFFCFGATTTVNVRLLHFHPHRFCSYVSNNRWPRKTNLIFGRRWVQHAPRMLPQWSQNDPRNDAKIKTFAWTCYQIDDFCMKK